LTAQTDTPELLRRLLERGATMDIDEGALQGTLMRGAHYATLLYQAFASDRPLAWINVYMPPELIFGCGWLPFWLDGAGGFSGWMEMDEVFSGADALLPSRDVCTFLRAAAGGLKTGLFPRPQFVACTSNLCEGAPKIARMAAQSSGAEFALVDVPAEMSERTIRYVADGLEAIAHRLCAVSGSKLDIDRLRQAIEHSNAAREHFVEAYEMRKCVPAPVTGAQFVGMGLVFPWGTQDGIDIARSLRDEIAARIGDGVPALPDGEKYRLLWLHLRPVFETDIMAHLERQMSAVVVADTLGRAWWPKLDTKDPFRALAIKVLSNPELAPPEEKIKLMLRLAEKYRVDGIVHFLQWGCRWNYGESGIYRKAAASAGLPFLALDGDAVDKRATPHGQLVTRLDGFVELLESSGDGRINPR